MKKVLVTLAAIMFGSAVAYAAAKKPEPEIVVPEKECQSILAYQPSPDTEYQPGVDVHGKPVVEADLTPPVVQVPETYGFDITVDMARYLGIQAPAGLEANAKVGTVVIQKDGQALFNGSPLEGQGQAALRAICAAQKPKDPIKKP